MQFSVDLKMELDRKERVPDILSKAMERKYELKNFKFVEISYDYVIISVTVAVKSLEELENMMHFFVGLPGVRKVVRV